MIDLVSLTDLNSNFPLTMSFPTTGTGGGNCWPPSGKSLAAGWRPGLVACEGGQWGEGEGGGPRGAREGVGVDQGREE